MADNDYRLEDDDGAHEAIPCKEARDALIIAIISIFCFGIILGPVAIVKATKAKQLMRENPALTGEGKATAAIVIGIISTILSALGLIQIFVVGPGR